ncbi:MAG: hypothetical protein CL928_01305 [Deltaproteobacteria bacterium]|nr:hypothetical protein [Deltaproteobacteria bacterium]
MGEVWRGEQPDHGVPVAIKLITTHQARDQRAVRAFRNEVRAMAGLDHPRIAEVFGFGDVSDQAAEASGGRLVSGSPYLVLEYLGAGSLDTIGETRTWPEVLSILLALLDALAHAHSRGLVHRDLKPANILFAGEENRHPGMRLTDFGIAHALGAGVELGQDGGVGTPDYMAPEQHRASWRDFGPWTDLYALGCIAYELVVGRRPFATDTVYAAVWSHLNDEVPTLEPRLAVPAGFDDWITTLLAKNPADRFQRAADAAFVLSELGTSVVWGMPPVPSTWKPRKRAEPPARDVLGVGLNLFGLRSLPVLGREDELDALWSTLLDVWTRAEPRVVVLDGGAGLGKSRVAEYVCQRADEVGAATILKVRYEPVPGPTTGLAGMVRASLGCEGLSGDELRDRVTTALSSGPDVDPDEAVFLSELIAGDLATADAVASRRPDGRSRHALLYRFLRRKTLERPVLLWIDDIQWGAEALGLLEYLLDQPPAWIGPLLVLATVRDESLESRPAEMRRIQDLLSNPSVERRGVGPLDDASCGRLARDVLGLDPDLAGLLQQGARGSPLFITQVVADWVESGSLHPSEAGFSVRDGMTSVPSGLHSAWLNRLSSFLAEHREDAWQSLEVAAALGMQVDVLEWNHACGELGVRALPSLVDALLNGGLARPSARGWVFAHERLRHSLARRARDEGRWDAAHAACGAMLSARYAASAPGVLERLGRHQIAAGATELGLVSLQQAAEELLGRCEFARAESVSVARERALTSASTPGADPRWTESLLVRSKACGHLGRLGEAGRLAKEAEDRSAGSEPSRWIQALGSQAFVARMEGDPASARLFLERALERASQDNLVREPSLLQSLAELRLEDGDFRGSSSLYEEAKSSYIELDDEVGAAECSLGLANLARGAGRLQVARELYEGMLDTFSELGHRSGMAASLSGLATVDYVSGDFIAARPGFERAWILLERVDSPVAVASGLGVALIDVRRRDWDSFRDTLVDLDVPELDSRRKPWLCKLQVFRMISSALEEDWQRYAQMLDAARLHIGERASPPEDVALSAEAAAELAELSGRHDEARGALELARVLWDYVEQGDEVARVDQRLAALSRSGAESGN